METSQLLLVVSDGRGLFLEGMEKVKAAVRAARDANVFLVFLALDNPENKVSRVQFLFIFYFIYFFSKIINYLKAIHLKAQKGTRTKTS